MVTDKTSGMDIFSVAMGYRLHRMYSRLLPDCTKPDARPKRHLRLRRLQLHGKRYAGSLYVRMGYRPPRGKEVRQDSDLADMPRWSSCNIRRIDIRVTLGDEMVVEKEENTK